VSGGHDDRGAKGASIEALKAPSEVGYGEGCLLPSRLGGLGEHHELPEPQNASGSKKNTKNCKFHIEKVVVTVTTTFKSGGDKSPSSHTKLRLWFYLSGTGSPE